MNPHRAHTMHLQFDESFPHHHLLHLIQCQVTSYDMCGCRLSYPPDLRGVAVTVAAMACWSCIQEALVACACRPFSLQVWKCKCIQCTNAHNVWILEPVGILGRAAVPGGTLGRRPCRRSTEKKAANNSTGNTQQQRKQTAAKGNNGKTS